MVEQGQMMWSPAADAFDRCREGAFMRWLGEHRGLNLSTHDDLFAWSVADLEGFWGAIWEYFAVAPGPAPEPVLADRSMPGAVWFPGVTLNYAEHALAGRDDDLAVMGRSQTRPDVDLTFGQLRGQVARARAVLRARGVGPGDRVVGYVPNVPEALVAFLATASLGAIWASCATEFGPRSVVDRFVQLEPKVLIVAGGYTYGDKLIDRAEQVAEIVAGLPSVEHVLDIRYGDFAITEPRGFSVEGWPEALAGCEPDDAPFAQVPFAHPLFILFSSGTTGKPKAIVHGHGGILLEHLKNHALSWDIGPGDRLLWFSTTAWMMWNMVCSALLHQAAAILVDGNPVYPDVTWQWRLAESTGATFMGLSPGFVMACRQEGLDLDRFRLDIRMVGAAGSPLPPEGYEWLQRQLGPGVQVNVGSGGTDICTGMVQGNPLVPVWAGEISARCLGVDTFAFDEAGHPVTGALGELVITQPMPSMPVGFWSDADGSALRASYFDHFTGVWRHGDWVVFDSMGRSHIAGRSDATLNRGGVRLGTAEFYRVIEELPEVADSLVVHLEDPAGGNGELMVFVVPATGGEIDPATIRAALRAQLSPRHVPDDIVVVPAIPRTLTGKKLELPVKRIMQGAPADAVASRDALADPSALDAFADLAAKRAMGS